MQLPDGARFPRSVLCRGRQHHVSRQVDWYRAGGRWWLGELNRDVWGLECGHVLTEVCRRDEGGHRDGL
ncbi:hypothetical protein GCM10008955_01570 [Deinococcus malanensis]|uniref:Uncharacterized protein n=1 Tax=Deinococcus malanensis TaxID=1706855 RepID=A0ABQ2EK56_9DEIO|nr:hypothetical protein [Deinococcus malanensis]GGK12007.1 hypothetical protein GCM10008955_01570 [Deinococcus malanensis]